MSEITEAELMAYHAAVCSGDTVAINLALARASPAVAHPASSEAVSVRREQSTKRKRPDSTAVQPDMALAAPEPSDSGLDDGSDRGGTIIFPAHPVPATANQSHRQPDRRPSSPSSTIPKPKGRKRTAASPPPPTVEPASASSSLACGDQVSEYDLMRYHHMVCEAAWQQALGAAESASTSVEAPAPQPSTSLAASRPVKKRKARKTEPVVVPLPSEPLAATSKNTRKSLPSTTVAGSSAINTTASRDDAETAESSTTKPSTRPDKRNLALSDTPAAAAATATASIAPTSQPTSIVEAQPELEDADVDELESTPRPDVAKSRTKSVVPKRPKQRANGPVGPAITYPAPSALATPITPLPSSEVYELEDTPRPPSSPIRRKRPTKRPRVISRRDAAAVDIALEPDVSINVVRTTQSSPIAPAPAPATIGESAQPATPPRSSGLAPGDDPSPHHSSPAAKSSPARRIATMLFGGGKTDVSVGLKRLLPTWAVGTPGRR